MEALKEWVRGLVLLVIVASLFEMLLPMSAMKKYVRMAMGLLIVLSVVRPVVGLLGQPVQFDPELLVSESSAVPSLSQIMAQAGQFRERNERLLRQEVQERLAQEARQAARGIGGIADAAVAVQVRPSRGLDSYQIEAITVTAQLGSRFGQVRPVDPVKTGAGEPATERKPAVADPVLANSIRQAVAERLGIADSSLIQVLVDQPGELRR